MLADVAALLVADDKDLEAGVEQARKLGVLPIDLLLGGGVAPSGHDAPGRVQGACDDVAHHAVRGR